MLQIQFSHANGFPAATYRTFFAALGDDVEIHAIDRIGHDPQYPVTDSWPRLVEELRAAIARVSEPPVLIGHSLGGFLSLMAAYADPSVVRGVVMLDAPILSSWQSALLAFGKRTGLDERYSPARLTKTRRQRWPDRASARAHFETRELFARFAPAALDDYVRFGLVEDENQGDVALAFRREIEYRIFRTLPHQVSRLVRRPLPVPVGFIAGTRSREMERVGPRATQRFVGPHFRWIEGGHLFPFERPDAAAGLVRALLADMGVA